MRNEDDQETGDLSPPTKKMKKSSPKGSPVVGTIVSYGLCYQEWLDVCQWDPKRHEFVCLSFGDLERLKQERDKCLKQDETLICRCRFCDKTMTQKKHNMKSHASTETHQTNERRQENPKYLQRSTHH
jgi:hypothetical protein